VNGVAISRVDRFGVSAPTTNNAFHPWSGAAPGSQAAAVVASVPAEVSPPGPPEQATDRLARIIQSLRRASAVRGPPARGSGALRQRLPLWAHHPLSPTRGVTATGCPIGQPEGSATGAGRGSRRRSHTRRYQSRCGQLDDSRTTIRRVRTTTSAATLMSKVRQVQGCPSPSGSRCRRSRKWRCRSAPSAPPTAHTSRQREERLRPAGWSLEPVRHGPPGPAMAPR
jgi:hypothetical protein